MVALDAANGELYFAQGGVSGSTNLAGQTGIFKISESATNLTVADATPVVLFPSTALDAPKNGRELWSTEIGAGRAAGPGSYPGPRSTPTVDGDRVYALGSGGHLICLTTAGDGVAPLCALR